MAPSRLEQEGVILNAVWAAIDGFVNCARFCGTPCVLAHSNVATLLAKR